MKSDGGQNSSVSFNCYYSSFSALFSVTKAHSCDRAAVAARRQAERDKEKYRQGKQTHSRQHGQTWAARARHASAAG